jgi:YD repeat-containing protein
VAGNIRVGGSLPAPLSNGAIWAPFAGSDFSIADLGLEFLHWPDQHLTRKEMKRSRSCKVLESINPKPAPGACSRVVSWIDNESDGIVMAQAYDSQGKLLKEFIPKKVKKVEGQWQLEEMEIDNVQTDSSTWADFDLNH